MEDLLLQRDLLEMTRNLEELAVRQEELSRKEEDSAKEQSDLNEKMEELSEAAKDLEKRSPQLSEMMDQEGENAMSDAMDAGRAAEEDLGQGAQEKANQNQKNAADALSKMEQGMKSMMMDMQMEAMQKNLESLRKVLENVELFSTKVEEAAIEMKVLEKGDPMYRMLLKQQGLLSRSAVVIEDSLKLLAERVPQIKEAVFKELDNMKTALKRATAELQEQRNGKAAADNQFSMMAANQLALFLEENQQSMMQMMAQKKPGNQNCQKPGQGKPKPGDTGKKMQALGEKLGKLSKPGAKPGEGERGLTSKEMAELMALQEVLREALKEGEGDDAGPKRGGNKQMLEELEKMEEALLEGRINEMNERFKRIETRMLENDKAQQQRKDKEEREAEQGQDIDMIYQMELEKYLQEDQYWNRQIQRELLRLNPFYQNVKE
jgi:hypothetical protein